MDRRYKTDEEKLISLEKKRERARNWMKLDKQENPEKYTPEAQAKFRELNPASRLIHSTRASAKAKNLEHNITKEDLILPKLCPYLGIEIDYTAGNGKTLEKPSVDRIDPSKGYIKGNVEVISSLANTMKNKATTRMLQNFALRILEKWPL